MRAPRGQLDRPRPECSSEKAKKGKRQRSNRPRGGGPGLLQRPDARQAAQQEGEIRTRSLEEIPLEDVLPPPQGRPPRAPVVEHMHERPLTELAALSPPRPAAPAPR